MQILGSVLPGVRELRSPLASGYLWLVVAWLAVGERIPVRGAASGVWERLYDLEAKTSFVGAAVALSFVAYLVGSLSEACFNTAIGRIFPPLGGGELSRAHGMSPRTVVALVDWAENNVLALSRTASGRSNLGEFFRAAQPNAEPPAFEASNDPAWPELIVQTRMVLIDRVVDEFDLLERRLIGERPELYAEADRLRAEADFRFAIVPPLVGLFVVLAAVASVFWLFGFLSVGLLYWQGVRRAQARIDLLIDALVLNRVQSPTLERLWAEDEGSAQSGPVDLKGASETAGARS